MAKVGHYSYANLLQSINRFTQTFNRPNLRFVVKPKKKVMEEILQYIKTKHAVSSGIVYCLSRLVIVEVMLHLHPASTPLLWHKML